MKHKRTYSEELKREAIALWKSSGKSLVQIAKELGISDNTLYGWKKSIEQHGEDAFPGSGHQTPLEEENRCLRRENEILRQERAILKKACAIFSPTRGAISLCRAAAGDVSHQTPVHCDAGHRK